MRNFFLTFICIFLYSLIIWGCASTKKVETEPAPIPQQTAAVETQPVVDIDEDEYQRSTKQMEHLVTKEVFNEDKKAILDEIAHLDTIMKNYDYTSWVTYVDQESLVYWENRKNLHKAATRLPVKGLQLDSLEDYFRYVFIQSRVGREIDEIRYSSDVSAKAVQVRDQQDIVYYYFQKINGTWKLHLPPLED